MKRIVLLCAALAATLLFGSVAHATRFKGLQAIDKETPGTPSWTATTPSWCSTRGWTRP